MSNETKDEPTAAGNAKAAPRPRRGKRAPDLHVGELWAKCPECRMPVKDAALFNHLLNCPGAEVRRAEWAAQQAEPAAAAGTETTGAEPAQ